MHLYEKYGPLFFSAVPVLGGINVLGPDATQAVFSNKNKDFSQEGWQQLIGPFFNRGLMLLDFDEHLYHRRIMQEAFTRPRLAGYVEYMDQVVTAVVDDWPTNDARFLFNPAVKKLTLDIASMVFMGHQPGTDDALVDKVNDAFTITTRAGGAMLRYPVPPFKWWRGLRARKFLESYYYERVKERRNPDGTDMLTALCHAEDEDGNRFTDEDIVNHMILLMMAAHETSTSAATTMAYNLAAHPEWQERCRDESARLGDGPLDIESLEKLETIELVMNESMRMVAPLPFTMRQAVRDTDLHGLLRACRNHRDDLAGHEPPAARTLDGAREVRSRALRRTPRRTQEAPLRVCPVRRRRAQMHRDGVRTAGDQNDHSPAVAPVPAGATAARLPAALGLWRHTYANGRHADRAASAELGHASSVLTVRS